MAKTFKALLINPWIYDVAAHDFWAKPIGLLYLAAILEQAGIDVEFVDCLDRYDPELLALPGVKVPTGKKNGTGHYVREKITSPFKTGRLDRAYSRYGMPVQLIKTRFSRMEMPDVILLTSAMTYWYPAVADMVNLCRECFPDVPVILGGIYASLCPDHAQQTTGADSVHAGEAESQLFDIIRQVAPNCPGENLSNRLDDFPFPAYHHYPVVKSLPVLTSRGCPFHCSFCASNLLVPKFRRRNPENVVDEIIYSVRKYKVRHFAFYDDALLVNSEKHLAPILRTIIAKRLSLHFHSPNGLHPRFLNPEIAQLMVQSGFETIRLSFETAAPELHDTLDHKVNNDELTDGIDVLEQAGFPRKKIEVYLLTGLPGQNPEMTLNDMKFVHGSGVKIRLAQFSPIPGTREWQTAVKFGMNPDIDLVETNSSVFARQWGEDYYRIQRKFHHYSRVLNYAIDLDLPIFGPEFFLNNYIDKQHGGIL